MGGVLFCEGTCGLMPLCLSHGSDPLWRHGIPHDTKNTERHEALVEGAVYSEENMVVYMNRVLYIWQREKHKRRWLDLVGEIMQVGPQLSGDQSPTYSDGR